MPDIQSMIGKEVEVMANGMRYAGVLVGVSDAEVYLKGPVQWIVLPVPTVSEIKLKIGGASGPERSGEGGTGQ